PALSALLKDKDANVRLDALQLLRDMTAADAKTATAVLLEALHDPQPPIRVRAALMVGQMGDQAKDAMAALVHLLADAEQSVRTQAASVLNQLKNPKAVAAAVPALVEMLQDKEAFYRIQSAKMLRQMHQPEAKTVVPPLVEA